MGDTSPTARAVAREDHLAWLRAQHADLAEHRRSSMEDEDTAVGSESSCSSTAYVFESGPSFSECDDVYRSLDLSAQSFGAQEVEVEDAEPVYRSLPMSFVDAVPSPQQNQSSESDTRTEHASDGAWLEAKRPPLLKRQRAFNHGRTADDSGLMLGLGLPP